MALEFLGVLASIAGVAMSFAHFIQAKKIFSTKSAKDISLATYSIFFIGSIIWLLYGLSIGEFPVIISFGISVIGTALVIILSLKLRQKNS